MFLYDADVKMHGTMIQCKVSTRCFFFNTITDLFILWVFLVKVLHDIGAACLFDI